MDPLDFSEFKTGQLVPITDQDPPRYAFHPDPLPPKWEVDAKLWPLVAEARDGIAKLDGISKWLRDPRLLLRPLQRREAWRSNMLEGTYASPDEFLVLEMESPSKRRQDTSPASEVVNYYRAMHFGVGVFRAGRRIDGTLIRRLHRILIGRGRGAEKAPGQYRSRQVYVRGRYTPPPAHVARESMNALESYLLSTSKDFDPLVRAYVTHYQFEAIHPFADGNGRLGRLLLSLATAAWLGHGNPWLYMSDYFDRNRNEYFDRMYQVSTDGAWREWIEFCLLGTREQAQNSIVICENLENLRRGYQDRCAKLGPRFYELVDFLFEEPFLTIPMVAQRLSITYPPASDYVKKLCDFGILIHAFGERPMYFKATEVVDTAYSREGE